MSSRVVAITGSTGYLGSRLTAHFARRGYRVWALNRAGTAGAGIEKAIRFTLGDPVGPEVLLGVDSLIHAAWDLGARKPEVAQRVNVEGSRALLQAASIAGVRRGIFVSTLSAFDGCRSIYGASKLAVEKTCLELGMSVVRPGLIHGSTSGGMVGKLQATVKRSRVVPLIGANALFFMTHEEDLARLFDFLIENDPRPPGIIVAAARQPIPFRGMLKSIGESLGRNVTLVPIPARLAWTGLRALEGIGLNLPFHSDSVMSLMNLNERPDFAALEETGLKFREF